MVLNIQTIFIAFDLFCEHTNDLFYINYVRGYYFVSDSGFRKKTTTIRQCKEAWDKNWWLKKRCWRNSLGKWPFWIHLWHTFSFYLTKTHLTIELYLFKCLLLFYGELLNGTLWEHKLFFISTKFSFFGQTVLRSELFWDEVSTEHKSAWRSASEASFRYKKIHRKCPNFSVVKTSSRLIFFVQVTNFCPVNPHIGYGMSMNWINYVMAVHYF